jgi:hypothetical protein
MGRDLQKSVAMLAMSDRNRALAVQAKEIFERRPDRFPLRPGNLRRSVVPVAMAQDKLLAS